MVVFNGLQTLTR